MSNSCILLIFHTYFSGKNVVPPLKLTGLLRLWSDVWIDLLNYMYYAIHDCTMLEI